MKKRESAQVLKCGVRSRRPCKFTCTDQHDLDEHLVKEHPRAGAAIEAKKRLQHHKQQQGHTKAGDALNINRFPALCASPSSSNMAAQVKRETSVAHSCLSLGGSSVGATTAEGVRNETEDFIRQESLSESDAEWLRGENENVIKDSEMVEARRAVEERPCVTVQEEQASDSPVLEAVTVCATSLGAEAMPAFAALSCAAFSRQRAGAEDQDLMQQVTSKADKTCPEEGTTDEKHAREGAATAMNSFGGQAAFEARMESKLLSTEVDSIPKSPGTNTNREEKANACVDENAISMSAMVAEKSLAMCEGSSLARNLSHEPTCVEVGGIVDDRDIDEMLAAEDTAAEYIGLEAHAEAEDHMPGPFVTAPILGSGILEGPLGGSYGDGSRVDDDLDVCDSELLAACVEVEWREGLSAVIKPTEVNLRMDMAAACVPCSISAPQDVNQLLAEPPTSSLSGQTPGGASGASTSSFINIGVNVSAASGAGREDGSGGTPVGLASIAGGASNTSGVMLGREDCFKCGGTGHWARDCPCRCGFRCKWRGGICQSGLAASTERQSSFHN